MKALLVLALCLPSAAFAQVLPAATARGTDTRGQDFTPAAVLARICVKEAGFESPADCAAIRIVLARVGRGDVVLGAKLYSPRAFDSARLGNRPWIAYLNSDGSQPRHWPTTMRWENYRQRWLSLVELSAMWIEHDYRPCEPRHWGAPTGEDLRRALSWRWTRVDCGDVRNAFWTLPTRRQD